jgi:CubicO group peptidase (beta-lactamase class C family)
MKKLLVFAGFLSISTSSFPQSDTGFFDNRSRIESWIRNNKVPALGIAIIREGTLREIRMYGELRKGNPAPYNAIFNVASLTKPVVSVLTYKLVQAGAWDLDEPLYKYWVDPDVAKDPRHKKLTTRMILSHQTGFKNWRYLYPDKKLVFESDPGTKMGYSGEGFEYLRRALENKFKKSLDQLTDSILFKPLGMVDTHHAWSKQVDEARFAHWFDNTGVEHSRDYKATVVNAADDLLTTLEDYSKFAVHVLNGAGIDSALYNQMIRPMAPTGQGTYMTAGWELFQNLPPANEFAILHTGSDAGVKSLVLLVPSSKQGLIIFMNGDNGHNLYNTIITELIDVGKEMLKQVK